MFKINALKFDAGFAKVVRNTEHISVLLLRSYRL